MDWLRVLELVAAVLPTVAKGIVAVLHFSGADRHATVAGKIAESLQEAGDAAAQVHKLLLNGVAHGDPSQDPPA